MGNRKKRDRLELRLTQQQKLQVERAAAISGRSITAFSVSVSVLVKEAAEVTANERDFSICERAWQALNGILERPARPIDGFAKLLERAPTFDA